MTDLLNEHLLKRIARLEAAIRKVPIVRMTDDALGWQCLGCGSIAGSSPEGKDISQHCKPDCWVDRLEAALYEGEP